MTGGIPLEQKETEKKKEKRRKTYAKENGEKRMEAT